MPATEEYWRSLPATHKVFAASSVALLAATIWMMAADHEKGWQPYQKQFQAFQADKLKAKEKQIKSTDNYEKKEAELRASIDQAQKKLATVRTAEKKVTTAYQIVLGNFSRADLETKTAKAQQGVDRANYDLAVRDNKPKAEADRLKAIFDATSQDVTKKELNLQRITATRDAIQRRDGTAIAHYVAEEPNESDRKRLQNLLNGQNYDELRTLETDEAKLDADKKKLEQAVQQTHKALAKLQPSVDEKSSDPWTRLGASIASMKRKSMEWPILDGFNSHLKIQQDWLPGLLINYGGMKDVARFDRCRTCHQGINLVEAGNVPAYPASKFEQPFSTHPRPDVYLTDASPHPVGKFGCTICHEGQGSATNFQNASHSPNSPDIAHDWEHEYKWFHNHFWEYPMAPARFKESGCLKCHHNVVELGTNPKFGATAPKVVQGYELIQQFGCFGCHEINGFDGAKPIGPDLRLEPSAEEMAKIKDDPSAMPGTQRKVGPSLVHIGDKTTAGWTEYWTEDPQRFRPATRMPKFFNLEGQLDAHNTKLTPIEIASIAHYLFNKSTPNELLKPDASYKPDAARGKTLFSQRGCLGCHTHDDFPGIKKDFGPNLTKINEKVLAGEKGRNWVYTWIRNPHLHHPRSRMPNLFLEPEKQGDKLVDDAADIAAFLLQKGAKDYAGIKTDAPTFKDGLKELTELYLSKVLPKEQADKVMTDGFYPEANKSLIKGDEIELYTGKPTDGKKLSENEYLNYIGRRTISRYGCYGCHEIPGFEKARPIGTALQNWGRKGKNKLAVEHIAEYLHHHGEPNGSSTHDRAERAVELAVHNGFKDPDEKKRETDHAFFYEQIAHGERAGFLWQKLRAPRSYDYKKIETKGYDERLRMPKFPFNQEQIEAISTFVLGLVAEPPSDKYIYKPEGPAKARIEGEKLVTKYNCVGCHILELPEVKYGVDPSTVEGYQLAPADFQQGYDLLLQLKPPKNGLTNEKITTEDKKELSVVKFHGLIYGPPDPTAEKADREYAFDLWETMKIGDKVLVPGSRILVPEMNLVQMKPSRGGEFAEWLVEDLLKNSPEPNRYLAWQSSPPPLYLEGIKVQTPWLYNFLKNPIKLRHTTVLRMPQFNMSDAEALALANYFAAVDGAEYPYQNVPERQEDYLAVKNAGHPNYLPDGWQMFKACVQCHSVGGLEYQVGDPKKDIRGPNLVNVADRLRPDWTMLWLYKPAWITPYTSMPAVFDRSTKKYEELFSGDGVQQVISVRDALMNYHKLTETQAKLTRPAAAPANAPAAGGGGN